MVLAVSIARILLLMDASGTALLHRSMREPIPSPSTIPLSAAPMRAARFALPVEGVHSPQP